MNEKKKSAESLKYIGALSGVLASPLLQGQIQYVDIADTTLNTNNAYYDLNIDSDSLGLIDYRFIQYVDTSIFNVSGSFIQARGNAANSVLGLDYANYAYPFNLSPGDSIGPNQVYKGSGGTNALGQLALEVNDTGHANDQFVGALNGLIGLRFRVEVDDTLRNFYGWARIDVAADYKSITIKDFAYNSQYGEGLTAGEGSTWIGVEEETLSPFTLQQLADHLHFSIEDSEAELNILGLDGKLVYQARFEQGTHRLALNLLDKGMYIARLANSSKHEEIRILVY